MKPVEMKIDNIELKVETEINKLNHKIETVETEIKTEINKLNHVSYDKIT
jgi:hypothetical protein